MTPKTFNNFKFEDEDNIMVSEEDAPLSQNLTRLLDHRRRFLDDCDITTKEIALRGLDFSNLVKQNPFMREITQDVVDIFKLEVIEAKLCELSTVSSLQKDVDNSGQLPQNCNTKKVTFGEYEPISMTTAGGILRVGEKCRFEKQQQQKIDFQYVPAIPKWGRDWDAKERQKELKEKEYADKIRAEEESLFIDSESDNKDKELKRSPKSSKKLSLFTNKLSDIKKYLFCRQKSLTKSNPAEPCSK